MSRVSVATEKKIQRRMLKVSKVTKRRWRTMSRVSEVTEKEETE